MLLHVVQEAVKAGAKTSVDDQPLRNILRWETCAASCLQRIVNVARQHLLKSVYMHQCDVLSFEPANTNHWNLPQVSRRMKNGTDSIADVQQR